MAPAPLSGETTAAERRLVELFRDGEWDGERQWLRRSPDRNAFMTANILLTLDRCAVRGELASRLDEARAHLADYQVGHRAFHWPLRAGRSAMAAAPPLWRHRWAEISPDADCTCLLRLARHDADLDDAIVTDLAFYRADDDRFRLPRFQRALPGVGGSFLTWFPPRERCRHGKLETVDAGVDANILWYLGVAQRLEAPGAAETTRFLTEAVSRGLVLREPFRVSLYYPSPAVLLFLISRAASWGGVPALQELRSALLAQLAQCPVRSSLEALCREAAVRMWSGTPVGARPAPGGDGIFYVGPLLAWPLQRCAPLLPLAARTWTQIRFRCEALEWALTLWLMQTA